MQTDCLTPTQSLPSKSYQVWPLLHCFSLSFFPLPDPIGNFRLRPGKRDLEAKDKYFFGLPNLILTDELARGPRVSSNSLDYRCPMSRPRPLPPPREWLKRVGSLRGFLYAPPNSLKQTARPSLPHDNDSVHVQRSNFFNTASSSEIFILFGETGGDCSCG